jgi:predicted protein tyrosine phosphatase
MPAPAPNAGSPLVSFWVTCLDRVQELALREHATHVVSFLDPSCPEASHPRFHPGAITHRKYLFFDQESGPGMPQVEQVIREFLGLLKEVHDSRDTRMVLHCHGGVSRSPAACYIALASFLGPGREAEAFDKLLTITEKPWPNLAMVSFADDLLARQGRLLGPLQAYRERNLRRLNAYRILNKRREFPSPVSRNP